MKCETERGKGRGVGNGLDTRGCGVGNGLDRRLVDAVDDDRAMEHDLTMAMATTMAIVTRKQQHIRTWTGNGMQTGNRNNKMGYSLGASARDKIMLDAGNN